MVLTLKGDVFVINSVTIAVYIGVAVICGAVFAIYGYKKGWKGGLSVFGISATAALCAFLSAPAVAGAVGDMELITNLNDKGYTAAEGVGIAKEQLSEVLEKSVDKLLEIPVAVLLFILFFIILAIVSFIIRKIMKCGKEQGDLKSKILGLSLAAVSIPLVLLFTVLVGKTDIFEETKRADTVMELISRPEEQLIEEILHNNGTYTDIFFETGIIEADEDIRLSLINSAVDGVVKKTDDSLLNGLYDFPGYSSRAELCADLTTIDGLYRIARDNKLLEEGDLLQKVFDIEDKRAVVDKIYSLKFRDILLRYILTISVRRIVSDESYIYPSDISFDGTEEELLLVLDIAQKVKSGDMSKIEAAKKLIKSPLLPKDVISAVIKDNVSDIVGDEMADKVTQYIEENDILEKIADSELPVEEVVEFIDSLQNGELAEELRINEIKDYLEDNKITDMIEDGSFLESIGADDELIENIKNGNYSDIDMEDILNSFGFTI